MLIRISLITLLFNIYCICSSQCFISAPLQVCQGDCGPVFWLLSDPPGTTYAWSINCGTITNPNAANPHIVCYNNAGLCEIDVVVKRPGEAPDTCIAYTIVEPTTTEQIAEIICQGDSVEVNGMYYTPGVYMDTIFGGNIHGCDSFLVILVAAIIPKNDTIATTFCSGSGDSIVVNGTTYDQSNPSGTEPIVGPTGCIETIVTIDLTYAQPSYFSQFYVGCQGDSFSIVVGGSIYNESNPMGMDTLADKNGCDSIVTTLLTFNPVYNDSIIYLGCTGDSFSITVDSVVYNESNPTGMDSLVSIHGCDSIITISLIFMPPTYDTITYNGCMGDGYSVTILDSVFNESNPTGTVIVPTSACDSIVFVDLHFVDCPDSLVLNGHQLCVSGMGSDYSWYTCYGMPLPDTTQCITVPDTGCVCVSFTDGTGYDTLCLTFNACELNCNLFAPEKVCVGDSVLLTFNSNDSTIALIEWSVMLDSFSTQIFTGTDSIWLAYYTPGCYSVQLELQDSGCISFCSDTICVFDKPSAFICCDQIVCDSCATLMVFLTGTPPFTIAIGNGFTIDTINEIDTTIYNYLACPPYDTTVLYNLLWVQDSSAACNGDIFTSTASVYLEQRPYASITIRGDTLCAQPSGLAYNWIDCQNTMNLSFNQCFVPSLSGCYCVTVSTLLTDCIDSACIDFIIEGTSNPHNSGSIHIWYEQGTHSILIQYPGFSSEIPEIQLSDLIGRNISYEKKEQLSDGSIRVTLNENTPSMVFVSIASQSFRYTQGIFIPFFP